MPNFFKQQGGRSASWKDAARAGKYYQKQTKHCYIPSGHYATARRIQQKQINLNIEKINTIQRIMQSVVKQKQLLPLVKTTQVNCEISV